MECLELASEFMKGFRTPAQGEVRGAGCHKNPLESKLIWKPNVAYSTSTIAISGRLKNLGSGVLSRASPRLTTSTLPFGCL